MAGHVIFKYLKLRGYEVTGIAKNFYQPTENELLFDVRNFDNLRSFIIEGEFDVIVNAVGVLIEDSVNDTRQAFELNALLPIYLNSLSKELHFKPIFISTDCVFDGKDGAYSVKDIPNAKDIYGLTKRLGEVIEDNKTLTIRTSIIGPELKNGSGLWNWFSKQTGSIYGFSRVFWSGVTTLELARYIVFSIDNNITGIQHLTNGCPISKFELLKILKSNGVNDNIEILKNPIPKSNKTLMLNDLKGFNVGKYNNMIASLLKFTS